MINLFKRLFLENRSLKQIVAKNTFWLVSAEVIARLLGLFLVVYVARILGATDYGKFTFAFSFSSLMAILCDLGLSDIATREFSRNKENEKRLGIILGAEIVLCFATLLIAFVSSFFITQDSLIRKSIFILTLFVLSNGIFGIIFSFLRARQKMEHEAFIKILQAFSNLAIVSLIIFNIPSVVNLSYGYLVSNMIILAFSVIYFNFYFQKINIQFGRDILNLIKTSWPLSLGLMIGWVYISINSVLLGYLNLITENGWYNAASKIAIVAILPAALIIKSFFPPLSNFFVSSRANLQRAWNYLMETMLVITAPIVLGGIVIADNLIKSFFGDDFRPSSLALKLLVVVIGISFINYPYSVMLVVSDHQKRNFFLIVAGAIINILLGVLLIPVFDFYGVIIASIISCIVVLCISIFTVIKMDIIQPFNKNLSKTAVACIISGLVMYFVLNLSFINKMNILIVFITGAFVYSSVLLLSYWFIFPQRILKFKNWKHF